MIEKCIVFFASNVANFISTLLVIHCIPHFIILYSKKVVNLNSVEISVKELFLDDHRPFDFIQCDGSAPGTSCVQDSMALFTAISPCYSILCYRSTRMQEECEVDLWPYRQAVQSTICISFKRSSFHHRSCLQLSHCMGCRT